MANRSEFWDTLRPVDMPFIGLIAVLFPLWGPLYAIGWLVSATVRRLRRVLGRA